MANTYANPPPCNGKASLLIIETLEVNADDFNDKQTRLASQPLEKQVMNNKTIAGLEHNAIDKISAAILTCEDGNYAKQRDLLMEAIGIIVEMRITHDHLIRDAEQQGEGEVK